MQPCWQPTPDIHARLQCKLISHTDFITSSSLAGMLTVDGRCKTLDAMADGYVRAEACIVMRLTAGLAREPDAAANGGPGALADSPAVVLLGSFVNQVRPVTLKLDA